MMTRFDKMHGLGNDFVVLDARTRPLAMTTSRARAIANRRTGIGCDQLILLEASRIADTKMRIYNADGGEVEACGNAARAIALLLGKPSTIETLGGTIRTEPGNAAATVDMGEPRFDWQDIPLDYAMDTTALPLAWEGLANPAAVNVGNPHAIFFVDDCQAIDLERLGPLIEHDQVFPDRINVNVASVRNREHIDLRVWERGVGLTRACGTGACATAVAAIRRGLVDARVTVGLPGGDLIIAWQKGQTIQMAGPATHVFTGEIDLDDFG